MCDRRVKRRCMRRVRKVALVCILPMVIIADVSAFLVSWVTGCDIEACRKFCVLGFSGIAFGAVCLQLRAALPVWRPAAAAAAAAPSAVTTSSGYSGNSSGNAYVLKVHVVIQLSAGSTVYAAFKGMLSVVTSVVELIVQLSLAFCSHPYVPVFVLFSATVAAIL